MELKVVPANECGGIQNGRLVVPCIVASRVGSDVEAAVNSSKLPGIVDSKYYDTHKRFLEASVIQW